MFEILTLNEALRLDVDREQVAAIAEYRLTGRYCIGGKVVNGPPPNYPPIPEPSALKYSKAAYSADPIVFPEMIRTAELYLSELVRHTRSNDQRRILTGILFVLLAVLIYSPIISVGLLGAGALCFTACRGVIYFAGDMPEVWADDLREHKNFIVSQGEQLQNYQFYIDHNLKTCAHDAALYWTGVVVGLISLVAGETAWMWLG